MTQSDGGPAFPIVSDEGGLVSEGMTLRDWFAGQAMYNVCDSRTLKIKAVDTIAYECYRMADAMLEVRKK